MRSYRIGGHIVSVDFRSSLAPESLLPNLTPFLHSGEGQPVTSISLEDDIPWTENSQEIGVFDVGGSNHAVLRTPEGGYQFLVYDAGEHLCSRMETDANFSLCRVQMYEGTQAQRNYGANNCVMMAYAFATATLDTLLVHSSVIRCEGYGYLMTAPSGTGKSTHTHLWYTTIPGCDLMNDDNPVIRIVDGQPMVYGSPWSGKTPCYRNIEAPIGGIVRIKQRPENSIRPLGAVEAFTMLLPACSNMKWDERISSGVCDSITKFVAGCGIWELGCLPNGEAAILCHDTVSKRCRRQNHDNKPPHR